MVVGTREEIAELQRLLGALAAFPGIILDGSAGLAAIKNTLHYPGTEPWRVKYGLDEPYPNTYRDLDILKADNDYPDLHDLAFGMYAVDALVDMLRWIPGTPPTLHDKFPYFPLRPSLYAPRKRHLADVEIDTLSVGALAELSTARVGKTRREKYLARQRDLAQVARWARPGFPEEFPPLWDRLPVKAYKAYRYTRHKIKRTPVDADEYES